MKTIFAAIITLLSFSAFAQDAAYHSALSTQNSINTPVPLTPKVEADTVTLLLTHMQTAKLLQADSVQAVAMKKLGDLLEFILDANHIDKNQVLNFTYQEQPNKAGALVIVKKKK